MKKANQLTYEKRKEKEHNHFITFIVIYILYLTDYCY